MTLPATATEAAAAAAAEAAPPTVADQTIAPAAAVQLEGDEIVQISIKPSLWYIPIVAGRFVALMLLLGGAVWLALAPGGARQTAVAALIPVLILAVGRIVLAALDWASTVYVLTNRRVLRFRGVSSVSVAECPLARISRVDLHVAAFQKLLRLGSISMCSAADPAAPVVWEHIAQPASVHEIVVKAVRKAQGSA